MIFELSQDFTFEAAHTLQRAVPLTEYEPSMRIHGHSYLATVTVKGEKGASGMIERFSLKKNGRTPIDLFYLRAAIGRVRELLDHRLLDEIPNLGPATLENLCDFVASALSADFAVSSVTVRRPSTGDSCTARPK